MVLAAGFQAFTGFGFSMLCTPILTLALDDVQTAILLLVLPSWFAAGSAAYSMRKVAPWPSIGRYLLIAPLGILAGVWVLDVVPAWSLELLLAILLLQVLFPATAVGMGVLAQQTLPSGFLAGLTAGSIGAAGPAVIAWAHSKTEWELPVRRAATLAVFASINPMRLPFYIAFGLMTTADIWGVAIGSIPFVVLGSFLGHKLAIAIPRERSEIVVKLAIGALALAMSVQAYNHITA